MSVLNKTLYFQDTVMVVDTVVDIPAIMETTAITIMATAIMEEVRTYNQNFKSLLLFNYIFTVYEVLCFRLRLWPSLVLQKKMVEYGVPWLCRHGWLSYVWWNDELWRVLSQKITITIFLSLQCKNY